MAAATMFAACQPEAALLGTTIEVSPSDAINFVAQNATPVSVTVSCDGDWISTSSDWIDVEPAFGTGQTSVKIVAKDNVDANGKVGLPREGSVSFAATGCKAEIPVTQDGDEDLLVETLPYTINFKEDMTKWKFSIVSNPDELSYIWAQDAQYGMKASAYVGSNHPSEAWLISPAFDLTGEETAILSFNHTYNYAPDSYLDVQVTKDGGETWTKIQHDLIHWGDQNWTFEESGDIDLSSYCGEKIKIAFVYTSDASAGATWEISDFSFLNTALPSINVKNNAVEITATTLEATFDIVAKNLEAGKSWTLTADEDYDWVTAIEPSTGTESAAVKVTVTENTDTENARTASFTLKSEGLTDVTMTLTQAKGIAADDMPKTIAELCEVITGTSSEKSTYAANLTDAVVTYVNGKNVFIEDASGAILYYNASTTTFTAGQKISGIISGEGYVYSGLKELSSMDLTKATVTDGTEIPLTTLTLAALEANFEKYISMRILVEDITVTDGIGGDDRDGELAQGENTMLLRAGVKGLDAINDGAVGDMIGFPTIFIKDGATKHQFGIWDAAHFTADEDVKTFSVTPEEITVEADATSAKITVSGNAAWTATASTGATVEPASGEGAGEITVSFAANEGADPVAYTVTVATEDDVETKSFEVTVNQKAAVVPAKTLPYEESFASSFGDFKLNDVKLPEGSTYVWKLDATNHCAKASSYFSSKNHASESWLVSPEIEMPASGYAGLTFDFAMNFGTASDYPNAFYGYVINGEEKTKVEFKNIPSSGSWTWYAETVDLSAFAGKTIKFAFVYVSTDAAACTVEVKNVKFSAEKPLQDNVITATATLSIEKGATAQIEASNIGNIAMTYTSSNEAVATVDASGLVTAVAAGNATITIATEATSEYKAASATCAVTVTDSSAPVTDKDIVILPTSGFGSSYPSEDKTIKVDDNEFVYGGVMYNTKNTPSGYGAKEIIQFRKSGSTAGYIYNKTGISVIKKIAVYSQTNKDFTLTTGTTVKPTGNAVVSSSVTPTTAQIACKDNNGAEKTATANVYTFDVASSKPTFFMITNGSNANYFFKIVITYGSAEGDEGDSGEGNIGIDDWKEDGESGVGIEDWKDDEDSGNNSGFNEGYNAGGNIDDWIVDPA